LCSFFITYVIFNLIPQCFKAANVLPLFKGKGSRRQSKNYRPIAILNFYCKIFERYLFSRLCTGIESQLIPQQHGFRKNQSCSSALRNFTNYLYSAIDQRKGRVVAVFVDLRKAFDSVDQSLLIQKLMLDFHVEPWYVKVIKEVFRNRIFKISNSDKYYSMPRGVRQGSALGPLLLSLFINSICSCFASPFLLYADDLVLYDSGGNENEMCLKLALQLEKLCIWCDDNGVNINFEKTKFMIFHKERDRSSITASLDKIILRNESLIECILSNT
jgi:hypothetical protein